MCPSPLSQSELMQRLLQLSLNQCLCPTNLLNEPLATVTFPSILRVAFQLYNNRCKHRKCFDVLLAQTNLTDDELYDIAIEETCPLVSDPIKLLYDNHRTFTNDHIKKTILLNRSNHFKAFLCCCKPRQRLESLGWIYEQLFSLTDNTNGFKTFALGCMLQYNVPIVPGQLLRALSLQRYHELSLMFRVLVLPDNLMEVQQVFKDCLRYWEGKEGPIHYEFFQLVQGLPNVCWVTEDTLDLCSMKQGTNPFAKTLLLRYETLLPTIPCLRYKLRKWIVSFFGLTNLP